MDGPSVKLEIAGAGLPPVLRQGLQPFLLPCQMPDSGLNWCSAPRLKRHSFG